MFGPFFIQKTVIILLLMSSFGFCIKKGLSLYARIVAQIK